MNAELMSEFKKEEFVEGLTQLGCDSIEKLRKRLPDLRAELNDSETFQKIYEFAYMFAREVWAGRRLSCCLQAMCWIGQETLAWKQLK